MLGFQPRVAAKVIAFPSRLASLAVQTCLSPRDRIELVSWREAARLAGYDRMVIHDCEDYDDIEVDNFLCLYRRGDSWSRWGFARLGFEVRAWCCLTSQDRGAFETLDDALAAVLHGVPALDRVRATRPDVVTDLLPRLRRCRVASR